MFHECAAPTESRLDPAEYVEPLQRQRNASNTGGSAERRYIKWHTIADQQRAVVDDVTRNRHHPLVDPAVPTPVIGGVPGDPVRSATLSREAAAAGNPYALRDHARNLETGYGQSADLSAAFAAMRAAATAGNAWAALDLARYFHDGVGTAVVPAREAYWLARAAGLDDPAVAAAASERLGGLPRDALVQAIGAMLEEQGEVLPGTGDQLGPDALAGVGMEAGSDAADLMAALLRLAR